MARDTVIGGIILVGSIAGILAYGALIIYWPLMILQISAFLAVFILLGIAAWIGYTMATTAPPEPIVQLPERGPTSSGPSPKQDMKEVSQ